MNQASTIVDMEVPASEGVFHVDASGALGRLRARLGEVISMLPERVETAADLERSLGIGKTLAWQVFKIAHATDTLAEGAKLPGKVAMKRFFDAAQKVGVPKTQVSAAERTIAELAEVVRTHAGDRATFDSMVSGLGIGGSSSIDLSQRRAVFKGNSHIWGLQAKVKVGCAIIQPSDDPKFVDVVLIRGVIGLRQLRHGRPYVISVTRVSDNDEVVRRRVKTEQLELGSATNGVNLLPEFCTSPLPQFRNRVDGTGRLLTELVNHDIGNGAAFTGFLCDVFRKSDGRYKDENNDSLRMRLNIDSPNEAIVLDTLIRCGTYGREPRKFRSEVWNTLGREQAHVADRDVLFADDSVPYLGRGVEALHSADYPRYVGMIQHVMGRLGWDPAEFEAYRYHLEYPVMPSAVVVECPLPEKPAPGAANAD
jgi:hypothetical protein